MSLRASKAVSAQKTEDPFVLPHVNESLRALLIVWLVSDVHFLNILSKIPTDHFDPAFRACLFIVRHTVRTANNPIEKLAGSLVLSSPLMNNSAVRVKAVLGDLVTDD